MIKESLQAIPEIERGNTLIRIFDKLGTYRNQPYAIFSSNEVAQLASEMEKLVQEIPEIAMPRTAGELILGELRRRLNAESAFLRMFTSAEVPPWQEVMALYGISIEDVEAVESWLDSNVGEVEATNNRLLKSGNFSYRADVPLGSGRFRLQAEELVGGALNSIAKVLEDFFPNRPGVKQFLDQYQLTPDFNEERSYLNWISRVVGVPISQVAYMREGKIFLIPEELLRIVFHEGLGHGCHYIISQTAHHLPLFLRTDTGPDIRASSESVAQYFEKQFFDYLLNHPEAAQNLPFEEPFRKIYQRYKDRELLQEYWECLNHFAILTLAQSRPENSQEQLARISRYSLDLSWPAGFINDCTNDWDKTTGRLSPRLVAELRYCANPVRRILTEVAPEKLGQAEELILTGFWTPVGLEQWVRFSLELL